MKIALFVFNVVLAVLWMLVWGSFDVYTLAAGLVVGYLLLAMVTRAYGDKPYGGRLWRVLCFVLYFLRILIKANLQVAWEVLTPKFNMTPRLIRYDVSELSAVQITTLANSITLTPGTLSVDISEDQRWLYVHCMYAQDRQSAVRDLDELRHRLLKGIFS